MNKFNIQDYVLNGAFSSLFAKYDRDNSGSLDQSQVAGFFNGLFQMLHVPITVGHTQSWILFKFMDKNFDGRISRDQIFGLLKKILNVGSIGGLLNGNTGNFTGGLNNPARPTQYGYNQDYDPSGYNQGAPNQGIYNPGGYSQGGYNQGGNYNPTSGYNPYAQGGSKPWYNGRF